MRSIAVSLAILVGLWGAQALADDDCPSNSHVDSSNNCVCNTGYMNKGTKCVLKRAQLDDEGTPRADAPKDASRKER